MSLPDWARRLDLSPHPEGGWFRETWRSELTMPQSALPPDYAGPPQRRHRDPVPAHARSAVGVAHRAQRRAVALSPRRSAAAGGRARTGRRRQRICSGADIAAGRAAAARRAARALAAGPPARRPALPGQLRGGAGIRLRRLRAGGRLPTEQLDRRGHQRGIARCGRAVRQPQRVLHPDAGLHAPPPACSSSGQQLSSRPCSSTGAGEPAAATWLSRSSAVAISASVPSSIITRMQCWATSDAAHDCGGLGVEDADLDAQAAAQQQPGQFG